MNTIAPKPTSAKRLASARENGSQGGRERASRYSGEVLSEWASRGGQAVRQKYGRDYFIGLRKRRKNYPKRNESPVIKPNWRVRIAWENDQLGGLARAARYSYELFREWGRVGGIETWVRYGNKFYREIRKKRTYYSKARSSPPVLALPDYRASDWRLDQTGRWWDWKVMVGTSTTFSNRTRLSRPMSRHARQKLSANLERG